MTRNVRPAATPASASVRFDASENKRAIPFALGTVETPGSIRYAFKQGTTLWVVRALALGERSVTALGAESAGRIDGLVSIKTAEGTDGIALATPPYASWQYWFYDGALAQGVDPNLAGADASWNETAVLTDPVTGEQRGICYVVEKYFEFAKYWGKIGLPKWIYRIRGSRLYDPRTAATAYSENTFLQWRYWTMDPDGRYLAPAEVNGPAFNAAANIADEALGSGKRYASHLLIESGTTDDWLKMFRLLGDAYWFKNKAGLWTPLVDRPAAAVASYSDLHYTKSREPEIRSAQDALQVTNKVTIEYTDTSGTLWKQEPVSLSSDRLLAGQEPEVEATYRLPELHDRAIVETKLRYLLYSAQDDLRAMLNWRANTGDRALGDVVTQAIPERGLSDDFRVISIEPLEDNTLDVELQLMSARKYQDTTSSAPAKVNSTMPEVYAAVPPDPGLTVTQEGINLKIELVPADSWAYYYKTRVLVQKGSDPVYILAEVEDGPVWLFDVQIGVAYTISAITLSTVPALQSNSVSQVITPSVPAPEPPGLVQQATVDGKVAYYLDGLPPVRTPFGLTAAMLSQANLSAFTAAALVDGNRANNGAQWNTASNNAYIQIDLGSATAIREVVLRWVNRTSVPPLTLLYGDDGSTFTPVSGADFRTSAGPGDLELYTRFQVPAAVGAHRWLQLLKSDTLAYTSYLAEIEIATYTGATYRSDFIKAIILRGWTPNQIQNTNPEDTRLPNQPQTRQYLYLPIASNPVFDSFTQAYRQQSTDRLGFIFLSFGSQTYVEAATINILDEVSEFAGAYQASSSASSNSPAFPPYSPQTYIPQAQEDVTLVNGVNGSVAITHISDLFRLVGPTSAFSIGGLQSGVAGKQATLLNTTAATCSLLQENASVPAAERFNFGATLSTGQAITVIYDNTLSRWVRVAASSNAALLNDAGYASLASPLFTGSVSLRASAPLKLYNGDNSNFAQLFCPDAATNGSLQIDTGGKVGAVVLSNAGEVGIGATPASGHLLDVVAAQCNAYVRSNANNTTSYARLFIDNNGGSGGLALLVYGPSFSGTSGYGALPYANLATIVHNQTNGLVVGTAAAQPLVLITGGTERVRIDSSGNVGIGTTPTSLGASYTVVDAYNSSGGGNFMARNATTTLEAGVSGTGAYVGTRTAHPVIFRTNQNEAMRIDTALVLTTQAAIKERGRSTAIGEWIPVTYASGNFAGGGGWTTTSVAQVTYQYALVGKTMLLRVFVSHETGGTSSIAGGVLNVTVAIPGGFTALNAGLVGSCWMYVNGAWASGQAMINTSGDSVVNCYLSNAAMLNAGNISVRLFAQIPLT